LKEIIIKCFFANLDNSCSIIQRKLEKEVFLVWQAMVQLPPQGDLLEYILDFPLFDPILLVMGFLQDINVLLLEQLVKEEGGLGP